MITFFYGSGSPYAWRVWLALEHKHLAYDLKLLSFSAGDTKKLEFLALNPRGKVPVLVDNDFVIYESAAILEYLDEQYAPPKYPRLFPQTPRERATVRRWIREIDAYIGEALEGLVTKVLFTPQEQWNDAEINATRDAFARELDIVERSMHGEFVAHDTLTAADLSLYPSIALALRIASKKPDLFIEHTIGPKLTDWMHRIEGLPYFDKTYPPHWR